ncbi:hypothetical protein [Nocardia spumae]|uniref:hypothetical protein n=1 Tax=Nocardia spumae TaxID=2887190 RepID=UPI001D139B8A|nr:hypothetical protein [Nocardia spumae]
MTHAHPHDDTFGEFAQELRALAEILLERIEPTLRRAAADSREWDSCSWCPVCAAAALVRGEHHDVVAAVADHGTAIVTVLREALAGVPVEPLLPDDLDEGAEPGGDGSGPWPDEPGGPDAPGPSASGAHAPGAHAPGAEAVGAEAVGAEAAGRPGAKHGGRGRHSAAARPGYTPITVRIKK